MTPLPLAGWAVKHGVSPAALVELAQLCVPDTQEPPPPANDSEARVQSLVRLEAARAGVHAWRNNVGALQDQAGRWVRFGLANDTPALNDVLKSSDLVGFRPVTITQDMVGKTIAQFWARECKASDWTWRGTERASV